MREGGLLGWATEALIRLDDEMPGVLSRVLTAAPRRRQAIFAALAARDVKGGVFDVVDELLPPSFAEVVRHGRVSDILRHAFSEVPEGLPGLLERIGERPLDRPQDYLTLHQMLVRGDVRAADALRGSGRISRRKLEVLSALDPRWHHAHTLGRIDTGAEAIAFNAAVEFVQSVCSRATDEVVARSLDRRESMVGGFPWTDESHPWPSHHGSDGQPIWAEPIFQLNLEKLSQQLGLRLPSSLIQCWDGFEPMEIPLAQTTGEPSWFRPNQAEEPSVGWRHSEAQYVGSYISAGSSAFQLPRMEQFLDGSAAYYDEYVFQNEDEWKDLLEWQESTPDIEGSQFDALAGEAHEAFAALKPVSTEFLGVPTRSEVSYEDWVKDGYKLLYSASGSGLHIWYGGFLMIFYRLRDGRFEFAVQMGS